MLHCSEGPLTCDWHGQAEAPDGFYPAPVLILLGAAGGAQGVALRHLGVVLLPKAVEVTKVSHRDTSSRPLLRLHRSQSRNLRRQGLDAFALPVDSKQQPMESGGGCWRLPRSTSWHAVPYGVLLSSGRRHKPLGQGVELAEQAARLHLRLLDG